MLVQAIANQGNYKSLIYTLVEKILETFIQTKEYKKYQQCDLLVIDDFQLSDDKEVTQEILLNIILAIISDNKRVILISTQKISKFKKLYSSLKKCIKDGLVLKLDPLDDKGIRALLHSHKECRCVEVELLLQKHRMIEQAI